MVLNHEKKEIIMQIHVYPNKNTNFNSKNGRKRSFPYEIAQQNIYPNKGNVFVVPNHARKGDYYVNPFLFQFRDELQF